VMDRHGSRKNNIRGNPWFIPKEPPG